MKLEDNIYRHEFAIKQGKRLIAEGKAVFVNDEPLDMSGTKDFVHRLEESLARLKEMENPSKE